MIKIAATLVTLSTFFLAGCGGNTSDDPRIDSFEVIACPAIATHTSITSPKVELINSPHRFVELYLSSNLDSQQSEPTIDFDTKSVISIHLGEKPSSGYSVRVTKVENKSSRIIVSYEVVSPSEGCGVDTGLTYPYCFVSIDKTSKALEYRASNIKKCSS